MRFLPWPHHSENHIKLGLERVNLLLERLGNPHQKLPPVIHIAGTNGKGSTLSLISSIFNKAGLRVHRYTSPHLVEFNERIVLAGELITDDFLNQILSECKEAAEIANPIDVTLFEGITIAAFLAFSRIPADLVLLETGMGGRFDATNILKNVICSVITPISMDHQEFLGNDIESIAREKAGIIKPGCPVFVGKQSLEVMNIIKQEAGRNNSKIISYENYFDTIKDYEIGLSGDHQKDNASLAAAVAINQKLFFITKDHIKSGLSEVKWPARLQKITRGKLFDLRPKNSIIYLDGSHNSQGAFTVKNFIQQQLKEKPRKIFMIFAMLSNKDCESFLNIVSDQNSQLIAMNIEGEKASRNTSEIQNIAKRLNISCDAAKDFQSAFKIIDSINSSKEEAIVLICGSLYFAGNFLKENGFS